MKKLQIAYFGTPYFSALFLEKLLTEISIKQSIEVKLVITQPDQPTGRKQVLTKSPVKAVAEKLGTEVWDFDIKDSIKVENLKLRIKQVDMAFLYAYGGIIPQDMINLPQLGFWNTHPSLLPKYRGALPVAMPLILGDKESGVTLIKLDEKVDHGPIIAQEKLAIGSTDKRSDLEIKLTDLAFEMLKKKVSEFTGHLVDRLKTKEQDHSKATFTYQINKDAGYIPLTILKAAIKNDPLMTDTIPQIIKDYNNRNNLTLRHWNSETIYNLFRGLHPWPGLWTLVKIKDAEKRLKISQLEYLAGNLNIKKVQLEGKREVDFKTFNSAYRIF